MSAATPALVEPGRPQVRRGLPSLLTRQPYQVGLLLILFLGLGLWYSLAVPPFETPDEIYHYAFARHIAQGNWLPVQDMAHPGPWQQEASQAPLYYLLAGALTSMVDQTDFGQIQTHNPHANIGDPLFPGNKNYMLYSAVKWPLQGVNLALHIGRWLSLLLGVLTLWFVYETARLAFPASRWLPLVALLLVAGLPQFAFISASFSNDSLIIATSSAVVYWLAHLLAKPDSMPIRVWEWVLLGVLMGLAGLSKLQGLGLFALAAFAILMLAWSRGDWRLPLRALLPVAAPALAIAGWWYVRNYTLYGDWLGVSQLIEINGRREDALTLSGFWHEFRGLRYSFWGLFGWFNILLPVWIYWLLDAALALAVVGVVLRILVERRQVVAIHVAEQRVRLLLMAWAVLSLALLAYWIIRATGSQGRLLLPGIVALAILSVLGLSFLLDRLPRAIQRAAWIILIGMLFAASLYGVGVLIPSAYAAPGVVRQMPATATPVNIVYGDDAQLELLAAELPADRYAPGERVPVTLYLRANQPLDHDIPIFVQLLDDQGAEIGNVTTHPGWGRNPTSLWQPGAIYADRYSVLVTQPVDARAPLLARLYVGFVAPDSTDAAPQSLVAFADTGEEITPIAGHVVIQSTEAPRMDGYDLTPVGAQFGGVIELDAVDVPRQVKLSTAAEVRTTLVWDALGKPATDYTAFAHLLDSDGNSVAGFDQAPAAGRFPTEVWEAGDRIVGDFSIPLPPDLLPGEYDVWVGLYESASQGQTRLPISSDAGRPVQHDRVLVARLEVTP